MDVRDKKMFNTYFDTVEVLANQLEEEMAGSKDRELSRAVEKIVADLAFATADMRDTVHRL